MAAKVTGVDTVLRNLRKAAKRLGKGAEEGAVAGAEVLLEESQKVVPVASGELRDSGKVVGTSVVYTAPHAVAVHEDLEKQHAPGKQAKFVEGPMRNRSVQKRMLEAIARPMKLK